MRIGFVWILSVKINKKILSIGDMLDWVLSTFARTIAEPILDDLEATGAIGNIYELFKEQ